MIPHILECSALASVKLAMQELGGHKHILALMEAVSARLIGGVVVRVEPVKVAPRMDDLAALDIVLGKKRISSGVPSALITIAPNNDTWVIPVALNELGQQLDRCCVVLACLPAGKLIKVKESDGVAHLQEMTVARIVAAYGIHIHLLNELRVL